MFLLGCVLLAVVLKLLGWTAVAEWSWWWILAPLAVLPLWWWWCDASGHTARRSARLDRERVAQRRERLKDNLKRRK